MAKKFHFKKEDLQNITPPATGYQTYCDEKEPHLRLRVRSSGRKTFYYVRKINGRTRYKKLGVFPDLTIFNARKKVRASEGEVASGGNPMDDSEDKAADFKTLNDLFQAYLAEHGKPHTRTYADDERIFNKYLKSLHKRNIKEIDRQTISRLHRDINDNHGPYMANRALEVVRKTYNHVIDKHEMEISNPARKVTKFKEHERERYLNAEELRALFQALENESDRKLADFFAMLLWTGQRRGNVQCMRWQDVDFSTATWTIPPEQFKTNTQHTVPLSSPAVEILKRRYKTAPEDNPYVFPSRNSKTKTQHLSEPKGAWQRIRSRAGLDDVRIHDLRRTFGSWMAAGGSSLQIIGKSLGHLDQQATQIYSQLNFKFFNF